MLALFSGAEAEAQRVYGSCPKLLSGLTRVPGIPAHEARPQVLQDACKLHDILNYHTQSLGLGIKAVEKTMSHFIIYIVQNSK